MAAILAPVGELMKAYRCSSPKCITECTRLHIAIHSVRIGAISLIDFR